MPPSALFLLLRIALVLVCSTRAARAIDPNRTISQYVRQRWGTNSGFPRGPVYSINQTPDGYLWIGTEKGLVRFDGLSFRLMQAASPEPASLSHVLGLVAANDGSLWVRLRRPTLLRYREGIFENVMAQLGRPDSSATSMTRARNGAPLLWVLDGDGSAIVLQDGRFKTLA